MVNLFGTFDETVAGAGIAGMPGGGRRKKEMSRRLDGRVAVVTGAGAKRGIGRAIAVGMSREGARVVAADIDPALAEEAAEAVRMQSGEALAIRADVAVAADVLAMVQGTIDQFGHLDILVNNAGIAPIRRFLDLDEETWDRTFAVNAKGVYLCAQAAAKQMIRQGTGGCIVNLSSISEERSGGGLTHYSATKAAVRNLTRGMASELGNYGIRVNAVAPGTIETNILSYLPQAEQDHMRQQNLRNTPLGRLGGPKDLVGAVLFLSSAEASFVTGITLFVDGGQLCGVS
jgi:NAD(P)-dependent dehydrogenase (short-subunit alcohol dehydrogenase family)